MLRILVVDDDKNIRRLIEAYLVQAGFEVLLAKNGQEALDIMDQKHLDMIVADIMMPFIDGYELVSDIRHLDDKIPILMITAKDAFEDKKRAFTIGADDYITKPIDLDEMLLRIQALLRRAKISSEQKIDLGDFCINAELRTVTRDGDVLDLPKKEFDLLFKLLSYPKKIFTRRQLMDEIWGMESAADERTVDVHIKRLREKFENCEEFEIVTVRGLGYKAERKG
ncbi:MAG: response regulator transcription factor [Defluviitaleaceae bacterium]|nr:response regulator transcription factor [Defluviitaleaceae bacterium]